MLLRFRPYSLVFHYPFGVSSNIRTETVTVFVSLAAAGETGYGEACLPAYLGGDSASIMEELNACVTAISRWDDHGDLKMWLQQLEELALKSRAAKAAIDIALHDLAGRRAGQPVHVLLGLTAPAPRATSFTIALDKSDRLEQKIIEASDFSILKIKAGSADDKHLIRQIRKYTSKPLYVDVNQGWKEKHMVLDMLGWMKEQNVLLVEQPMPVKQLEDMAWVTEKSPLPTIADESAQLAADLETIRGAYSGVNIKLMKSGGISEALRIITKTKSFDMKVMLGCMAESSCGTAAMAQLLAYADFVDLDAPRLYRNDPFSGLSYDGGSIHAGNGPGIGLSGGDRLL